MDVEKQIETLRQHGVSCVRTYGRYCSICDEAATALSTLQAENSQLRESRDHWKRLAHELSEGVNGKDAEHERLQAENEKLRAERERKNEALDFARTKDAEIVRLGTELERVKLERDAAVEQLHGICSACKNYSPYHNRGKCRFCTYEPARDKDAEVNDNWEYRGPKED